MRHDEIRPAHNLNDLVLIKRWRVTGTVVARSYSPLRYDIQCAKKLHRGVPAKWVETVSEVEAASVSDDAAIMRAA